MKHERGYSTQWQEKQMKTFTAKKYQQLVGIFFCQLWFYVLQSLTSNQNLKMVSHKDETLQRTWTDVYREGEHDNICHRKRDKREAGDGGTMLTLNVSHSYTRLQKKAPGFRHPNEVLKIARNNASKLFTDGCGCFVPRSNNVSVQLKCLHHD